MSKQRKLRLPKTLALQILVVMLASSIVPLSFLAVLTSHTTRNHFLLFSGSQSRIAETGYINTYQSKMNEQISLIDREMLDIEHSVKMAKTIAEAVFSDPQKYPAQAMQLTLSHGNYYEPRTLGTGVVRYRQNQDTSSALRSDLSRSKYLNVLFMDETKRNKNIIAMVLHPS